MATADRIGEDIWEELRARALDLRRRRAPVYSPIRHVRSDITSVTRTAINRTTDAPHADPEGSSPARRVEVLRTWDELVRTGSAGRGRLRFVLALLDLVDGVDVNHDTGLLVFSDRAAAMRPYRQRPRRNWSFFANPRIYNIDAALEAMVIDRWIVRDKDVRAGDRVLIWRGASLDGMRGVVAFADVLSDPESVALQNPFWIANTPPAGASVEIRYVQPDGLPALFPSRESVPTPYSDLSISRVTGGGIYEVSDTQWASVVAAAGGWIGERGGNRRRTTKATRITAAERKAIEMRAVDVAIAHFEKTWTSVRHVGDEHDTPYDLLCTKGSDALRVEVKGKTASERAVTLTWNEVEHARKQAPRMALALVSKIKLARTPSGPVASDGRLEVWLPWDIDKGELAVTQYSYTVPAHGVVMAT